MEKWNVLGVLRRSYVFYSGLSTCNYYRTSRSPESLWIITPVPPPNSEIKERIRKRYESKRIKIEKLLTLGYTTSGDP